MRQHLSNSHLSSQDICRFFDFDVVDQNAQRIGNVSGLWQDPNGRPTFIAVKTSWLFGKVHIIPLQDAQVDPEEYCLYVPYEEDDIKSAPAFPISDELTPEQEREIRQYYGTRRTAQEPPPMSATRAAQDAPTHHPEEATMALHEEQLHVGKKEVSAGEVRLRKVVRTETVNQPVELKREDVVVERVPAQETPPSGQPFQGEEQVIPPRREETVVEKENRIREGVRVRKTIQTERENISEELHKEDVEVLQGQNRGEAPTRKNPDKEDRNADA